MAPAVVAVITVPDVAAGFQLVCLSGEVETQFLARTQTVAVPTAPTTASTATEATVTNVVGTGHKAVALAICETVDVSTRVVTFFCTHATVQLTHPAIHHAFLDGQVQHGFVFSVVYAGHAGKVTFAVVSFHIVYDVGGEVLQCHILVVDEIFLAVNQYLRYGFTVDLHCSILFYRCAW